MMPRHRHVIYVPPRRTAGDVWVELLIYGELQGYPRRRRLVDRYLHRGHWATVDCDGTCHPRTHGTRRRRSTR